MTQSTTDETLSLQMTLDSALTIPSLTLDQLRQMEREKKYKQELIGETLKKEIDLQQQGRGSETSVGRGLLRSLVPAVAKWLELHDEAVRKKSRHVGQAEAQYSRLKAWLEPFSIAHLGVIEVHAQSVEVRLSRRRSTAFKPKSADPLRTNASLST